MNDSRKTDVLFFNVREYLWGLLEQWRPCLLTALAFAVLITGVKYVSDVRNAAPVDQEESSIDLLPGVDLNEDLFTALTYYSQWQDKQDYYYHSFLMNSNATEERRLVLRYYVKAEEGSSADLNAVVYMYTTIGTREDFLTRMAAAFGINKENKYFKELFSITSISDADAELSSGATIFAVSILLPADVDTEQLEKSVTGYIQDVRSEFSKTMGVYKVSLVSANIVTTNSRARADAQIDDYKKLVTARTQFETEYNKLDENMQVVIDSVIEEDSVKSVLQEYRNGGTMLAFNGEDQKTEDPDQETEMADTEPRVKPVYAVLGLILGFALYAAVYFLYLIASTRIRDEERLEITEGLRSFGAVYKYPYVGLLPIFFHSRRVYALRHRGCEKEPAAVQQAAERIAVRTGHLSASSVTLLAMGQTGRWAENLLKRQAADMKKVSGIDARVVLAEKGLQSITERDLTDLDTVCLAVLSNETTMKMVTDFLARAQDYKINVIGTEYLEGI